MKTIDKAGIGLYRGTWPLIKSSSNTNHFIGEKTRELLDSILYAKRLQEAMMPSPDEITNLIGRHFILNKPKDIVGGDFYFVEPIRCDGRNLIAVAVADCTGHGIPGAFLSMSGYGILKNAMSEISVNSPSEALEYLNTGISKVFRTVSKLDKIRDGMDISFCALDLENRTLEYAGANNKALVIKKDKTIIELIPDRRPIGYCETNEPFSTKKMQLEKGDMLYLFSDGYKDQFGGPNGKKMGYQNLVKNLQSVSSEPVNKQKKMLETIFNEWKADIEQIDDVLIFGIRIA